MKITITDLEEEGLIEVVKDFPLNMDPGIIAETIVELELMKQELMGLYVDESL